MGNAFTGTYNLIGNADGSEGVSSGTNQAGSTAHPILPLLGPLQNNGGATWTRALLPGSPAIDKGNSPGIITDQRGLVRPYDNPLISNTGDGSDVGAYETQFLAPSAADVSISGRVLISNDEISGGVSGAIVNLMDAGGNIRTARTNAFGYYQFEGITAGETYIFTVSHKRHEFTPQAVNVLEDMTELNFIAL